MTEFQVLTDFGNLYTSYLTSMKGNSANNRAIRFDSNALENLLFMKEELESRTYEISPYNEFIVSEPKKRIVKSGSFRDKVLQHCLCDHVLLPKMKDTFIRGNFAGQLGKGTLFGLNCLSEDLSEFYDKYGSDGYVLKCDITKFFYNINHDILKDCIRKYFDDDGILWVCDLFIDSTEGDGLPLGNQCSQVFALILLDGLDHYVTENLGCEYYGRYMDDFYLLSNDKEYLKWCLVEIERYIGDLGLTLNQKTEIVPMKKGIRFLGFHTYITDSGTVIRLLTGDNKRKIKKRLRKYAKLVSDGKMTAESFYERYMSWRNHASHGNCYNLINSMDEYVGSLCIDGAMAA